MLVAVAFKFTFGSMRDGAVYTTVRRTFNFGRMPVKFVVATLALVVVFNNVRHVTGIDDIVIPIVTLKCVKLTLIVMVLGVARLPTIVRVVIDRTFK